MLIYIIIRLNKSLQLQFVHFYVFSAQLKINDLSFIYMFCLYMYMYISLILYFNL